MRTDAIVRPSRVVAGPYVPPAQVFTWTGVGTFRGSNNDQLTGPLFSNPGPSSEMLAVGKIFVAAEKAFDVQTAS